MLINFHVQLSYLPSTPMASSTHHVDGETVYLEIIVMTFLARI